MENNENSFWKNTKTAIPGRPKNYLPKNPATGQEKKFQKYQDSVQDAWSLCDDEFTKQYSILSETGKKASNAAALNVIKSHKSNNIGVHKPTTSSNSLNNNHVESSSSCSNASKFKHPEELSSPVEEVTIAKSPKREQKIGIRELSPTSNSYELGRLRQRFNSYPGRPQLLKLSSMSLKDECESKMDKFKCILDAELLNLKALKELSWSGIPRKMRPITWRLLSGYLPTSLERRNPVLERKRIDYQALVKQYFHVDNRDESQQDTFRQIHIDVPRMNPHVPLFQQKLVQEMFERILFIWAIRHPASGYVQGINDLVTPFFIVFLQETIGTEKDLESCRLEDLTVEQRDIIEADSFWCLSKFLDCIQDNYIFAQLGIQEKVNQLKELIQRIDASLHKHLQVHGVDYLQFSFRWMNNLLTRELPLYCTIRLWDTYLAESDGFAVFQLYVCAAFLLHWKDQLKQEKDFQGLMLLLQNLPTHNWTDSHISILVAEAFRLKFCYADAPKHFEASS